MKPNKKGFRTAAAHIVPSNPKGDIMKIDHVSLRLSAQRALLGAITESVLAIFVQVRGENVEMDVFTEKDFPVEYKEILEDALIEIHADHYQLRSSKINYFEGSSPPFKSDGFLVFLRHGYPVEGAISDKALEE